MLIYLAQSSVQTLFAEIKKKCYINHRGFCGFWTSITCFWLFCFRLEPIFDTALADLKNNACFKIGQKRLENNHLDILKYVTHSVEQLFSTFFKSRNRWNIWQYYSKNTIYIMTNSLIIHIMFIQTPNIIV
jgi:hypothetical protein